MLLVPCNTKTKRNSEMEGLLLIGWRYMDLYFGAYVQNPSAEVSYHMDRLINRINKMFSKTNYIVALKEITETGD